MQGPLYWSDFDEILNSESNDSLTTENQKDWELTEKSAQDWLLATSDDFEHGRALKSKKKIGKRTKKKKKVKGYYDDDDYEGGGGSCSAGC